MSVNGLGDLVESSKESEKEKAGCQMSVTGLSRGRFADGLETAGDGLNRLGANACSGSFMERTKRE